MLRLKGRPLSLLVEAVDHGRLFSALTRLRQTGQWLRQEFRYVGPQGAVIDGLTDARTVALDDGDRGDVLLTITDLTERNAWLREVQRARDEAERARADYHHILQSVGDGILGIDSDGRILLANRMAERLMDGPARPLLDPTAAPFDADGPARLPGTTAGRRFIDANGNRLHGLPPAAEAARSGAPVVERIVGIVEGEEAGAPTRWLRVSSHPVADAAGGVEAVVSSVADITAVKALERELNVALDARERFLAAASHDLRQPVQALILLSNLMLNETLPDEARRLAEQLQSSIGGLGGMLDGMLDISKLEAGLIRPDPVAVDVGALMTRLHGEFAPVAAKGGQRLRLVAPALTTRTDPGLLERVLRNLLANALRYAPGGRVLFGARRRGGRLQIEVWDTGIGIADQHIDRIFQDFFQVGNAARDRREGLGLGLSIAKRLVTMLGGRIDVTSALGRDSRFLVSLPLTDERIAADGAGGRHPPLSANGDHLIMLVEDDAVIRMALVLMLEDWGYRVVEAGSGTEASERLDAGEAPDLVLADYRLPEGTTGLMVMDMVRRRLSREVPGVLLTGDTSADRLREAAGAQCALLHKPIQPARLRDALNAALNATLNG
ncbi:histidine kinase [Azospirillum sp. TSO35-2]|nr:histidine kinase [Azospirillum sp. TSO35-2]